MEHAKWGARSVSFVSLGDGLLNNGHFLSAVYAAADATHRGFKCPVFCAISIMVSASQQLRVPPSIQGGTTLSRVRRSGKPVVLVFRQLPRRFGRADTDRQAAYLSPDEVSSVAAKSPLESTCAAAVDAGFTIYEELSRGFANLSVAMERAFDAAAAEPKDDSREEQCAKICAPLAALPPFTIVPSQVVQLGAQVAGEGRRAVMRQRESDPADPLMGTGVVAPFSDRPQEGIADGDNKSDVRVPLMGIGVVAPFAARPRSEARALLPRFQLFLFALMSLSPSIPMEFDRYQFGVRHSRSSGEIWRRSSSWRGSAACSHGSC